MRALVGSGRFTLGLIAVFAAGCGGNIESNPAGVPLTRLQTSRTASSDFTKPALITLNTSTGALEYWAIESGGGYQPTPLSGSLGIYQGYGLVANGNVVAIANDSPAEVVTYNVKTKATKTLPDPYGGPYDIAVDRKGTLYAMNLASVAVFKSSSSKATELSCSYMTTSEAIGVDNEGDVFVNGYGPDSFMGVIEYAAGSTTCTKPQLKAEQGYATGVGVDPKTDALLVVDNPDQCAGGLEGEMTIYPKPYNPKTAHHIDLNAQYCAGTFRLNSTSDTIFVSDATVSDGFPIIDQESFPGAKFEGTYQIGASPSGSFGGFTTIPNTLPN